MLVILDIKEVIIGRDHIGISALRCVCEEWSGRMVIV